MQDADLRSRVTHLLHMRQIRDLRNVAVEVVDGTATLHGKVRSFYLSMAIKNRATLVTVSTA